MKNVRKWTALVLLLSLALTITGCSKKTPPPPAPSKSTSHGSNGSWVTDFAKAKQSASTEGKNMLVNFSGSDWCYWCKKLDGEVFSKDDFISEAEKKYVLVTIDFPSDTSGQSQAIQQQNEQLAKEYKIEGYPTVILMDAEGKTLAKTGYQPGGPSKYLSHLNDLIKQ